MSVAFSPDGKRRRSPQPRTRRARLWDAETGKPRGSAHRGMRGRSRAVAFSPDGNRLTGARQYRAAVGRRDRQADRQPLRAISDSVWRVAFSPDGDRIAHRQLRPDRAAVGRRDRQAARHLRGHTSIVWSVAFSPDGRRILTGGDKTARLWDADGADRHGHRSRRSFCGGVQPDGNAPHRLAMTTARLWDRAPAAARAPSGDTGLGLERGVQPRWQAHPHRLRDKTARLWDARLACRSCNLMGA